MGSLLNYVGAENLEEAAEAVEMYAGGEDDRPERGPHNGSWKTACPAPPLDLSEWFEEHIARAEEDAKSAVLGRLGRLPYRRQVSSFVWAATWALKGLYEQFF
eukprot:s2257_g4.t1